MLILILSGCADPKDWRPEDEVILDCEWLSQRFREDEATLNCGPTTLVMAAACVQDPEGGALEAEDLLQLMGWMVDNIDTYEVSPQGDFTSSAELVEASEDFYGLNAEAEYVGGNLEGMFADLMEGKPSIVATFYQNSYAGEMSAEGAKHFMLAVGMNADTIFFHDPAPFVVEDGAFRSFSLGSFVDVGWDANEGVRFLTE